MTSLAQNFFLALMRAVLRISRARSARDRKWNGQPQDPGFQTEPGAPFAEGEERRGPSTAQPNHLTGSEMGRVKLGCSGRDDRVGLGWGGSRSCDLVRLFCAGNQCRGKILPRRVLFFD